MPELTDAQLDDLVDVIDKLDPPRRRRKLGTKVALTLIFYVLRSGVAWKDLQLQMRDRGGVQTVQTLGSDRRVRSGTDIPHPGVLCRPAATRPQGVQCSVCGHDLVKERGG